MQDSLSLLPKELRATDINIQLTFTVNKVIVRAIKKTYTNIYMYM